MSAEPLGSSYTFEEFLRFEGAYLGEERFELSGGHVVMMSGGSERHDLTVLAVFRLLDPAFTGGPCRVFVHNRKLRTSEHDSWYPDLLVRCGPRADALYETDARIVVEVWSPSNDVPSRTAKLYAYQTLQSVELILFLDPEGMVATVHERTAQGIWGERQIGATGTLALGDGTMIDFARLWADVAAQESG